MSLSPIAVSIRPCRAEDKASFAEALAASSVEVSRWMPWVNAGCNPAFAGECFDQFWYATRGRPELNCVILDTDDCFVGHIAVIDYSGWLQQRPGQWNLGLWIATPHTGLGIGTESARQMIRRVWDSTDLTGVELRAEDGNIGSHRIAQKVGGSLRPGAPEALDWRGASHAISVYDVARPTEFVTG